MKTRLKRMLCVFIAICLCASLLPNVVIRTEAASTGLTLAQLRQKFPNGKYWNHAGNPGSSNSVNNQNGYTSTPCSQHGVVGTSKQTCNGFQPSGTQLSWQCMGYAEKLGYDATGYNPRNNSNGWYTYTSSSALDKLKPGDIVRYKNNGHSIYVTGVNGDTVTYTDCNSDGHCVIRWDVTISKSTLRSSFTHVRSAPFAVSQGSTSCSCSTTYAGTYVCTTSNLNLTIRSGHGSSYSAVGSIPPGATVTVTKASGSGSSDWAHVQYNGVSGYASMQYLTKKQTVQNRNTRMHLWLSDSAMGASINTIRTGEWLYLCYKLYDGNTGDLFDTYNTSGYTAKLTLYEANGSVAHTCTYTNDNNWISIKRSTPGTYKGELVFTYNSGGTTTSTVSINMVYEPRVTPSSSDIQLNVVGTNSQTISISYPGATKSNSIYLNCTTTGNCFNYTWGSWSDHKMPLTVTGVRAGQGTITIEMHDSETDEILATSKVYVTVSAPTYTVIYNANGGSGAPESQIKYHNTTLTLSSAKPTRTGYTFLGWSTSSSATSASYQPGSSFTNNVNTTLYAVWKSGCESNSHSYSCKVTKTPTTSSKGSLTGTCSQCSGTTVVTLPELNTNDYIYVVKNAATCTSTGLGQYTWKTTTYGFFKFYVTIPATGHSYTKKVTAPTCTEQGYTTHTCSCGYSYKDTYTNATGHSFDIYKVTQVPTATETGSLTGICSKCKIMVVEVLPKLTTTDYSYKVTKVATCLEAGTGQYTWKTSTCGNVFFDVSIPATGHIYTNKVTAPTCTEQGYTTHTCSCGYSYKDSYTNALGHNYSNGSCTRCGLDDPNCVVDQNVPQVIIPITNKKVTVGETFNVPIVISNSENVYGGNFTLQYDSSKLTAQSYSFGSIVSGHTKNCNLDYQSTGNLIRVTFSGASALGSDGTLVTVTFTAKETGMANLKFNEYKMYDKNGSSITTLTSDGNVTVEPKPTKTLSSVFVQTKPTKTTYYIGDELNTSGMQLKLTYSDGSTEIVTEGFITSGFSSTTAGTKTVTVSYGGKTTTFSVTVNAPVDNTSPAIVVDTVKGRTGETVTVNVMLKNNPGFGGMAYDVKYDNAVLELISYELNLGSGICTDSGKDTYLDKVNFQYAGTSNITGDGALVTFTFKIKESASEGVTSITIVPEEGTFFTYDNRVEVDFEVACVNGGIDIVKYIKGDINGDGKVNNRDAARLLQQLAGWDVDCVDIARDVNGDGKVNNRDAARILQYLAGWDVELY